MALTVNRFVGFETGGQEQIDATVGTPDVQSTTVIHGAYSCELTGTDRIALEVASAGVSDAGDGHIVGCKFRIDDTTPNVEDIIISGGNTNPTLVAYIETDGDIRIEDNGGATLATITTPLTADTEHTLEFYIGSFNTSTGSAAVFLDGSEISGSPFTNINTSSTRAPAWYFGNPNNSSLTAVMNVDDCYILTGATASSEVLSNGNNDWFTSSLYRSSVASSTDNGSALDSGNWDDTNEVPFTAGAEAEYNNSGGAKAGSTDCDSGSFAGPSGDSDLTGATILAGEYLLYGRRGNGGSTTHELRIGNSGGDELDTSLSLGNSNALHSYLTESSTYLPTTSEYFRIGGTHSGGDREMYMECLACALLYTKSAGGGGGVATLPVGRGLIHSTLIDRRQLVH